MWSEEVANLLHTHLRRRIGNANAVIVELSQQNFCFEVWPLQFVSLSADIRDESILLVRRGWLARAFLSWLLLVRLMMEWTGPSPHLADGWLPFDTSLQAA